MSTIEGTIGAGRSALPAWRVAVVAAALVVGLLLGFELGRTSGRADPVIAPALQPLVLDDYSGPGHVPRHWVDG